LINFSIPNGDIWYFFSSVIEGVRKLYYTVGNDFCVKTKVLVIEVVSSNGSLKRHFSDQFKIYPNPSKGEIFLNVSSTNSEKHTFKVMDVYGKLCYTQETAGISNGLVKLDLNHLPKGIYFVEHNTEANSDVHKLVLK